MRGRPTRLTPAVADEIVRVFAAGGSVRDAAASTGVAARTIWSWRARAWSRDPADARCVAFERRVRDELARSRDVSLDEPELDWSPLDWQPLDDD